MTSWSWAETLQRQRTTAEVCKWCPSALKPSQSPAESAHLERVVHAREWEMIADGEEEMDEQDTQQRDGDSQNHELHRHRVGEGW